MEKKIQARDDFRYIVSSAWLCRRFETVIPSKPVAVVGYRKEIVLPCVPGASMGGVVFLISCKLCMYKQ